LRIRLRFLFYGSVSVLLKIRQIHNIFIPHYFHWKEPVISPDWFAEFQKILFGIQNMGKTVGFAIKTLSAVSTIISAGWEGTR
jgi:hypothetical protein